MKTRSVNSPWKYFHRCLIQWNITSLTVKFSLLYLFLILKKIVFIWLYWVWLVAHGIYFPDQGSHPDPPALGVHMLATGPTMCWLFNCVQLWDSMDCSPPGSSVHEILQARVLEWVSISYSRGSSQPRDQTWVPCIAGRFFTIWAIREAHLDYTHTKCSSGYCMGTAEA